MKKLIIVAAALFAMSAFAADTTTETKPADAGMAKDSGAMKSDTASETKTTTKKHKVKGEKKAPKKAPADAAPKTEGAAQ